MTTLSERLVRALPDIPRWVETRSLLLSGQGEVLGLEEETLSFIVREAGSYPVYASVVGRPAQEEIAKVVGRGCKGSEILAVPENRSHVEAALRGWRSVTATLHTLGDDSHLPDVPEDSVRLLSSLETVNMRSMSSDLRSELEDAVETSPVAAAFIDERPVSFCYAGAQTESLWDVSIDTLEGFRNRGYATRCMTFMTRHMRLTGKQPIWGAEETNEASLGLAAKLGFVAVDELVVLRPPDSVK